MPNQCWQADVTHWHLADGGGVEILNLLDGHSRLAIARLARRDEQIAAAPLALQPVPRRQLVALSAGMAHRR